MAFRPILERGVGFLRQHRRALLFLFLGIAIPLFLFGALAEDVFEREPFPFDEPILQAVHARESASLDRLMLICSWLGNCFGVVPLEVAVFIFLFHRRRWNLAWFWLLAVGGSALLNISAKLAFGRVRPDLWVSLAPETTFSFPSGHAMGSMAFVVALSVMTWQTRWRWLVVTSGAFFVLLVGLSRVYLGVHYPSDILAGWAASLAWVLGVSLIYGEPSRLVGSSRPRPPP